METDLRAGVECTYINEVDDEFELSSLKAGETLTGVGERHERRKMDPKDL